MLAETSFQASKSRVMANGLDDLALMPPVGEYHDNIESAMAAGLSQAGSRAAQKSLFDRADWLQRLKLQSELDLSL